MLLSKLKNSRFVRFCIVGGISSMIDVSLLFVLVEFLGIPLLPAATTSFAVSSINGYLMNRSLTFGSKTSASAGQYLQFLTISTVGLGLTLILLHGFTAYLHLHYLIAKILTIGIVVFWNYRANSRWTFK